MNANIQKTTRFLIASSPVDLFSAFVEYIVATHAKVRGRAGIGP